MEDLILEEIPNLIPPIHPENRRFKDILERSRIYNRNLQDKSGTFNWVIIHETYSKHGHGAQEYARFKRYTTAKIFCDNLLKTANLAREDFVIITLRDWRRY